MKKIWYCVHREGPLSASPVFFSVKSAAECFMAMRNTHGEWRMSAVLVYDSYDEWKSLFDLARPMTGEKQIDE